MKSDSVLSFPVECIINNSTKEWEAWEGILNMWVEWLKPTCSEGENCDFFSECREDTFKNVELALSPFLEPGQKLKWYLTKQLNMDNKCNLVVPKNVYIYDQNNLSILLTESIILKVEEQFVVQFSKTKAAWTPWNRRNQENMRLKFTQGENIFYVKESDLELIN